MDLRLVQYSQDLVSQPFYKFLADGMQLFPSEIGHAFKNYSGAQIGMQVLPALGGVGYICGPKISSYMFAGGTLSWFVLMPMIALFGGDATIFPASVTVNELLVDGPSALWANYIKYIGAGAVATGGIISLIKSLPLIVRTFKQAIGSMKKNAGSGKQLRTEQDLPFPLLIGVIIVIAVLIWILPIFPVNPDWCPDHRCIRILLCNCIFSYGWTDRIF